MRWGVVVVMSCAVACAARHEGAPRELASFLHAHASDAASWQVTLHQLGWQGEPFLGRMVKRTFQVRNTLATELIAMLSKDASFDTSRYRGEPPCTGEPVGLHLARGQAALDLLFDCGRFYFAQGGRPVLVSPAMYVFMDRFREQTLPCGTLTLNALDVQVCADHGATISGPPTGLLVSSHGSCPSLMIGEGVSAYEKYRRRVGTFDLYCLHDDRPACMAICDSLEPIPNSTATAAFPAEAPVIQTSISGGIGGIYQETRVWRDGTVLFAGPHCRKARGAIRKVTAQQVASLLARIEATGFFDAVQPPPQPVRDGFRVVLRVTNGRTKTMNLYEAESPPMTASMELVESVIGINPCR
jgi:hypothetical protein